MRVILTGATGMVGEGVLLECLANPAVERVLVVGRRPIGRRHEKLSQCIVADFRDLGAVEGELAGYDACFYCAGISSVGVSEADYTVVTYETPLAMAQTLLRLNPQMVFVHVSGGHTDSTERGKVMWARVKGKAENALARLPFRAVFNLRPGLMKPTPGQENVKGGYKIVVFLYPLFALFLDGITLTELGRAMIHAVLFGAPQTVLEAKDIKELAQRKSA